MNASIEFRTLRGRLEAENGWTHYSDPRIRANRKTVWQRILPYRLAIAGRLIHLAEYLLAK